MLGIGINMQNQRRAGTSAPPVVQRDPITMRGVNPTMTPSVATRNWWDGIGNWAINASGTTGSSNAGPGSNSPGPYIYLETSSFSANQLMTMINGGNGTDTEMAGWLSDTGARNIEFLYNYVAGDRRPDSPDHGFFVAEQLDSGGNVIEKRQWSDWAYNNYAAGQTINLETGTTFISELDGGWRRVGMDLMPACETIRLGLIPDISGSAFVNDLAFYDMKMSRSGLNTATDTDKPAGASGEFGGGYGEGYD